MSQFLDTTFLNKATREHFVPGLQNQLYDEMPLFKQLMVGAEDASGRSLIYDVPLYKNSANGQFKGYSYVAAQEGNLLAQASMNWANYYASLSISLDEIKKNSGATQEKLVDMLSAKFDAAKSVLKENVYKDLFLSLTARGSFDTIVGLAAVCATTNTYAGINRSTTGNEGWKSNLDATSMADADLIDPTTKAKYLPSVMRTSAHNASHDSSPSIIITTPYIYEIYEFIGETRNLRLGGSTVNLGFGDAKLSAKTTQGNNKDATLYFDKYCTAKYMFFITPEKFKSFVFPGCNFEPADMLGTGDWQRGQNQLAASMQLVFMGQILCTVPREQAALSGLGDA